MVIADALADRVITIGGIFVILAVLGILAFLVAETLPLFQRGKITASHEFAVDPPPGIPWAMALDEYKSIAFVLAKTGKARLFHAKTGFEMAPPVLGFGESAITAVASTMERDRWAFGFSNGKVRFASLGYVSEILPPDALPQGVRKLDDRDWTDGLSIFSRIPGNQFRKITFELRMEDEIQASDAGKPIIALDYRVSGQAERQRKVLVAYDEAGQATISSVSSKVNLLTGQRRSVVGRSHLPALPETVTLHALLLRDKGDQVFVADRSGKVYRYDITDFNAPVLAEEAALLPPGARLNFLSFLLGGESIVAGGSDGSLNIYFLLESKHAETRDGKTLQLARELGPLKAAPLLFSHAQQGKTFAVVDVDGAVRVLHATSQKVQVRFPPDSVKAEQGRILLAPRMDGVLALQQDGRVRMWEFSVPHPETSFTTLFRKVWYEGYPEPTYTWQSSAATEDYEPKLSLIPLIFGTVKAAFYSLLFAIPIAILGAIYTSEFVHYKVRSLVKPTMEMMASLPSVVLGFVAALVMAPVVETWLGAILIGFLGVPLSLIMAAYLWQLLPLRLAVRLQGIPKFSAILFMVMAGIALSLKGGPWFERVFFGGDLKAWLNRDVGGAEPFLLLLSLPLSFVLVMAAVTRFWGRALAQAMTRLHRYQAAVLDIGRWVGTLGAAFVLSLGAAKLLAWLGVDPRGGFVGTYVQRNTLIVGFAMGFAVIPIIYTIAEDALNAVPEHLRAASLGCGATPWQTAVYVVLPTAISGVFSAVMIGMGRAVGETMIVVMAAGNTPIIDWNIFNGLRALSATIAVELPEAVKDGTLYRILFLSGLVLFSMTFVINTFAEIVRLRFRKKALQL